MPLDADEFRSYLKIDKNALDDAVIQQSMLYYQVSESYAQAAAERDSLKEALATTDAKLDGEVRKRLTKTDNKFTEGTVKSQIQIDPKHETAFKSYIESKERADILAALRDAFQTRAYMLRDLIQLHVTGFFQETSIKPDVQSDNFAYSERRRKLSEARAKRQK